MAPAAVGGKPTLAGFALRARATKRCSRQVTLEAVRIVEYSATAAGEKAAIHLGQNVGDSRPRR